jgi:hypothetical protein
MLADTETGNFTPDLDTDIGKRGDRRVAEGQVKTPHSAVTKVATRC